MAAGFLRRHRSSNKKRSFGMKGVASKALKVALGTRRMLTRSIETKYYDSSTPFDAQTVSNSGQISRLADLPQGTDEGQHEGNKVMGKYLSIRGYWQGNSTEEFNLGRFMIFIDTSQAGTDPTVSDVLAITADNQAINAPVNFDHTSRYKVIYDKVFAMQKSGTFVVPFKIFKRIKKNLWFTGTTTGTQYKNQIYCLAVSDVSANDPSLSIYSRFAYTDA